MNNEINNNKLSKNKNYYFKHSKNNFIKYIYKIAIKFKIKKNHKINKCLNKIWKT